MRYVKLQFGCLLVILYIVITYIRTIKRGRSKTSRQYNLLMLVAPIAVIFDTDKWKKVLLNLPEMISVLLTTAGIMAIADVFDAVSQKRCYRDAMTLEDSFSIIAQGIGTDFDPHLAQIFLDNKDEVIKLMKRFQE